jgi:hypothetical protein
MMRQRGRHYLLHLQTHVIIHHMLVRAVDGGLDQCEVVFANVEMARMLCLRRALPPWREGMKVARGFFWAVEMHGDA